MLNGVGVPVLLLSLILGIVWAYMKVDHFVLYDAKVLGSFTVFATYSFIYISELSKGYKEKKWRFGISDRFLFCLLISFCLARYRNFTFNDCWRKA